MCSLMSDLACDVQMKGHLVKNGKKVEHMTVSGKWDEAVFAHFPDGTTKELWRALPPHAPMQNT